MVRVFVWTNYSERLGVLFCGVLFCIRVSPDVPL
jgi:hypothetical protein